MNCRRSSPVAKDGGNTAQTGGERCLKFNVAILMLSILECLARVCVRVLECACLCAWSIGAWEQFTHHPKHRNVCGCVRVCG